MTWDDISKTMDKCAMEVRKSVAAGDMPRPVALFFYGDQDLMVLNRHGRIRDRETFDSFMSRVREGSLILRETEEGEKKRARAVAIVLMIPLHMWKALTGEEAPAEVDSVVVGHIEHATKGVQTWICTTKGAEATDWSLWRSGNTSVFPPLIHEQFYGRLVGQA